MTAPSPEKRQDPRVPIHTAVSYSQNGIVWHEGRAVNINHKGMLLQADTEFARGERLHLVFRLPNRPGHDLIEAKARVVRAAMRRGEIVGLAVQFFHLRSEHSRAIADFIRRVKHGPRPGRPAD